MSNAINDLLTKAAEQDAEAAWEKKDVGVEYSGTKIVLPASPTNMPFKTAFDTLKRLEADANQEMEVYEVLDAMPKDALVALHSAMKEKYGWASAVPTPGFFGPTPPQFVTVETGPKPEDKVQVPSGRFQLPGVENPVDVFPTRTANGPVLVISGTVRKAESHVIKDLAILARAILKEHSIYKGKAINIQVNPDGEMSENPPKFLETDGVVESDLILNPVELMDIQDSIWNPIKNTEKCRAMKIPLNRGALIEGPYGCGKTMTAHVTSKICVDNGWTYILLDDVRALKDALLMAQRYQPALIFAEDAERVAEHRDQRGNDLLNTIDGVLTKEAEVFVVLTTNFVEKIDKAMLRPGRFDAVISVRPPEPAAVESLLRVYGRDCIKADTDLSAVSEVLAGEIPATIREVVERTKLGVVAREDTTIVSGDLVLKAQSMKRHLELLQEKPPEMSKEEAFGHAFKELVGDGTVTSLDGVMKQIDTIEEQVDEIHDSI